MKIITPQTTKDNALMKDLQRRGQADAQIAEHFTAESEIEQESNPMIRNAKKRHAENKRLKDEMKNGKSKTWSLGTGGASVGFSVQSVPQQSL